MHEFLSQNLNYLLIVLSVMHSKFKTGYFEKAHWPDERLEAAKNCLHTLWRDYYQGDDAPSISTTQSESQTTVSWCTFILFLLLAMFLCVFPLSFKTTKLISR
jgi:hypothetical protein